ncbi:MAG: (2Fe-2S)-binding protein [Planctomycetaceae bacterium]
MSAVLFTTGRIVCHCLRVTEEEVIQAASDGNITCIKQIMDYTGAGGGCTACHQRIRGLLAGERARCEMNRPEISCCKIS